MSDPNVAEGSKPLPEFDADRFGADPEQIVMLGHVEDIGFEDLSKTQPSQGARTIDPSIDIGKDDEQSKTDLTKPYIWSKLNKQQVGAYTEYFVKMELTMHGFEIFTTEIDDRGIDFIARVPKYGFIEIQVKSLRKPGYVFIHKRKFDLKDSLYLALGLMIDEERPDLYLIPATVWRNPNAVFVSHDYEQGLKSEPEWGLNLSRRNMAALEPYRFEKSVRKLLRIS